MFVRRATCAGLIAAILLLPTFARAQSAATSGSITYRNQPPVNPTPGGRGETGRHARFGIWSPGRTLQGRARCGFESHRPHETFPHCSRQF